MSICIRQTATSHPKFAYNPTFIFCSPICPFFLVTNFRSKRRELPTWINFYANLLSLSTHMSNGPLLGKMYNSSVVNLISVPLLLSKKSLPAEQRIIKQN